MSLFFKGDLFGLDVRDGSLFVEFLPDGDDVRFVSCSCEEDGLWRNRISIGRDDGADQAIGFSGAWGCPPEGSEEVVVNNGAVELGVLKASRL